MTSEKALRKAVVFGTICLLLTGCFYHHYSTQEVLNGIYETDLFDEHWTELYCSYKRSESMLNYFAFDVSGCEPDKSLYFDDIDPVFEKYYFKRLTELEEKKTIDPNYRFILDEPYYWVWLYGASEVFNYGYVRDEEHVREHPLGSVFVVYLENAKRVYTLEVDYH